MKQICLILILIFGMQFGSIAFGQVPVAPQQVEMIPLVDFSLVFDNFIEMFRPHFVSIVGIGLSIFVAFMCIAYIQGLLDGKLDMRLAEQQEREKMERRVAMMEAKQEAVRLARQLEMERSGYVDSFEIEYRSAELQRTVLRDDESFSTVNDDYFVRSESHLNFCKVADAIV